ncbi:MAG: tetratricopeptide repeat protein [Isosphaeraceae bacterium]|nr:tetratricopeptide repeat protein [Isosphaeraceae bacterium]
MNGRQSNRQTYRVFNFKAFLILVVLTVGGVVGIHFLHGFQVNRSADKMLAQAEKAESEGRLDDAVRSFRNYTVMRPKDRDAQSKFGRSLAKTAKTGLQRKAAADTLSNAAGVEVERTADLLEACTIYNEIGLFSEARDGLTVVLRNKPEDADALYQMAISEIGLKDFKAASDLLTKAQKADPKLVKVYPLQAELHRRQFSQADRANVVMDTMVAENRDSADAYIRRGSYRMLWNVPGGEADIDRAAQLDPKVEGLDMARIDQAIRGKDFDKAAELAKAAIERFPADAAYPNLLARLQTQLGKPAEAVATLEKALERFPDARDIAFSLADNQVLAGKLDAARELIAKLRESKFPEAPLQYLEGAMATRENKWDAAYALFEKAESGLKNLPELAGRNSLALGVCLERVNQLEPALAAYRKALEASPSSPVIRERIAKTLTSLGRLDEAAKEYRAMATGDNALASLLVQLQLVISRTLQQPDARRNWAEAEKLTNEIAKLAPDSTQLAVARAELLAARGRSEEALVIVDQAKAKDPKSVGLFVAKAALLQAQGKFDEARAELDSAPADPAGAFYLRLAKIDHWTKRGGPDAVANLDQLADKISSFREQDQNVLQESLTRAYLRFAQLDKAAAQLKTLVERRPDDLTYRLIELEIASRRLDDKAARDAIAQIKRIEGDRGITWRLAEMRLALTKVAKGDKAQMSEVNRLISEVEGLRPGLPELTRIRAEIEELENRGDQALAQLALAIKQGSRQPSIVRRYIQLLANQGRFLEADRTIRQLETVGSLDAETKKLAAELALRSSNRTRAAELVRSAVPASSRDADSLRWRGRFLLLSDPSPRGRAEARESFATATQVDPSSADNWIALVEYDAAVGDRAGALANFEKGLTSVSPKDKLFYEAIGNQLVNRLDTAKSKFEQLLSERPGDRVVIRAAAAFFQKIEQFRVAEKLWRSLIAQGDSLPAIDLADARVALAELLSKTGNPKESEEALSLLDSNLKAQPNSLRDRRAKIDVLSRRPERRKEAIALLLDLNSSGEPLNAAERIRLAQLYTDEGDWTSAKREMNTLLNSPIATSDTIATYVNMLLRHKEPADLDEAEKWIDKLIQTEKTSLIPLELRARLLIAKMREKEAAEIVEAVYKANAKLPLIAAEMAERLGLDEPAERYYKAVVAAKADALAPFALARYYARKFRHKEALDIIEGLRVDNRPEIVGSAAVIAVDNVKSELEPNKRVAALLESLLAADPNASKSQIPLMLAVINTRIENFSGAEEIYRKILAQKPGDIASMNNLAWMLAIQGKAKEATPLIDQVITSAGPSPKFVDTRGMVRLAAGEVASAIDDFRDAIAGRPDDLPAIYFHLALAQNAQKQDKDARESIEIARKIGLTPEYLEGPERKMYEDLLARLGMPK